MIDRDDLRAAVASGLLTEKQTADLTALAHSRKGAREDLSAGDEPFELFRGFNEIFIMVGLGILAAGWVGITAAFSGRVNDTLLTHSAMSSIVAVVLLWLLSEYFIRRRRMVGPAILLSLLFGANALVGFSANFSQPFMVMRDDYSSLPLPVALATVAMAVFWVRFRVPFAMAMIAVALFVVAVMIAAISNGSPEGVSSLFMLSANGPFAWITLALGLLVFGVAMYFDMSDPHRVTRRSAQGFWLHVVAAPALVNTVGLTLLAREGAGSQAMLLGFLALFAIVAIIIDRRSFLIAAIGYVVTLALAVFEIDAALMVVFGLGVFLLLLGAFWERIRARLLLLLPSFMPLDRLPPSH